MKTHYSREELREEPLEAAQVGTLALSTPLSRWKSAKVMTSESESFFSDS